jgi:hypothetical protein
LVVADAPFTIVARTETVPAAVVFNVLPLMVAPVVPALTTIQVIVLLVAVAGLTVPVSASPVPAVAVEGTPVMLVTATKGGGVAVTVIEKSCV